MQSKKPRQSATAARAERYGLANQMAHETAGRVQRKAMRAKLDEGHAAAKKRGAARAGKASTGMNAGTMRGGLGGSWMRAMGG